jgi:hypothetical protein
MGFLCTHGQRPEQRRRAALLDRPNLSEKARPAYPSPESAGRATPRKEERVSSTARPPEQVVTELRAEWTRAKADPSTNPADLHVIEVLGQAVAVIDQVFNGGTQS